MVVGLVAGVIAGVIAGVAAGVAAGVVVGVFVFVVVSVFVGVAVGVFVGVFVLFPSFLLFGCSTQDHYKEFGGDAAAYSAPANDLQGVKAYSGVDMEGLYTLGTVVLDYRGFRVTAQSIIPGECGVVTTFFVHSSGSL